MIREAHVEGHEVGIDDEKVSKILVYSRARPRGHRLRPAAPTKTF